MPKSSTLMLLRTLVARGYAVRDSGDGYAIQETFSRRGFGWGAESEERIAAVAIAVMERLREPIPETYLLGAPAGLGRVKVLAKVVSPQEIRYDADIAKLRPAYCTAMGRVLLAFADPATRELGLAPSELVQLTPATLTDPKRLRILLGSVRKAGYAVVEEEYVLGGAGAAAPIFGRGGRVIAALDVASVTARFHEVRAAVIASAVEGARQITALVGGRQPLVDSFTGDIAEAGDLGRAAPL